MHISGHNSELVDQVILHPVGGVEGEKQTGVYLLPLALSTPTGKFLRLGWCPVLYLFGSSELIGSDPGIWSCPLSNL